MCVGGAPLGLCHAGDYVLWGEFWGPGPGSLLSTEIHLLQDRGVVGLGYSQPAGVSHCLQQPMASSTF